MAKVTLQNLRKVFPGGVVAVDDVSLQVNDREFVVLVGPSGCGKSTILRMIAGLEEPTAGDILIGDFSCRMLEPKDRDIAMVFQSYALYPHMTVRQNLEFGLKLSRRFSRSEIDVRVEEAAEILDIDDLLHRKPRQLSGGQRQRVALGRCIVRKPRVFLFDEPLSNLDAKMRIQMRVELGKLHARLQSTMIYVTHDQTEAMTMGDRIVCMRDGRVQQIAPPLELYSHPANEYVASFIGMPPMNFVLCSYDAGSQELWTEPSRELLPVTSDMKNYLGETGQVRLGVRPEDLEIAAGSENSLESVVEVVEPLGSETYLYCRTGQGSMVTRLSNTRIPEVGERVFLRPKMEKAHLFDPVSGASLLYAVE